MEISIKFQDSRKWGDFSFLDLLEKNNISFTHDGEFLSFPNLEARQRARSIWYHLVGTNEIGVFFPSNQSRDGGLR